MNSDRNVLACIVVALAAIMVTSTQAHAEKIVVLIDASGSMSTQRADGKTRFIFARDSAAGRIDTSSTVNTEVAVYLFKSTTSLIEITTGFETAYDARVKIEALDMSDVGGSTPLAGALCSAIDVLEPFTAEDRDLWLYSDGEENSTPMGSPCWGDHSDWDLGPGSWQANVLNHATTAQVPLGIELYDNSHLLSNGSTDKNSIVSGDIPMHDSRSSTNTVSPLNGMSPLEEFYFVLAQSTGGRLRVLYDDELLGDLNNDGCVDYHDAILMARAFGSVVQPISDPFDLNLDGVLDYGDYETLLSLITPTCGWHPYVPSAPLVCSGRDQIVIDGWVIEDSGTTIEASGQCQVTIRDSFIVSGDNAITIDGQARVTVDDSIFVGQNAVIVQSGKSILSAASTIFHGYTAFQGRSSFIDRGGNIFE